MFEFLRCSENNNLDGSGRFFYSRPRPYSPTTDEENHVPARLWVHNITQGRQQQGADHHLVQELHFDDARFAANCDWSVVKKMPKKTLCAFFLAWKT